MRELKRQLIGALLAILTMAAVVAAAVNFQQQRKFRLPEDGVTWIDRLEPASQPASKPRPAVVAFYVEPEGPGAKAGIKAGQRFQ